MSSDMLTHAIENSNITRTLTWKDIAVEKWKNKAEKCQCRPSAISIVDRCRLTNDECSHGSCPFVYWDCL